MNTRVLHIFPLRTSALLYSPLPGAGGGRRRGRLRGAMQTLPRTRCQPRGPESRLRTRSSAAWAIASPLRVPGVAARKRGAADGPDRREGGARGGGRSHTWHSGFASHDPAPDVSALLPTLASPRPKVAVEALQRGQPGPLRGKRERERGEVAVGVGCLDSDGGWHILRRGGH